MNMIAPREILLVEDERIIALDLKRFLDDSGYRVTAIASSGANAISKAAEFHPSLALMDIHLEGPMDGIEAARRIHDEQHIPVVFLTAYADEETLQRAKSSNPYGFLVKPCEARELRATLQVALARSDADARVAQINAELEARVAERTAELNDTVRELESFGYSIAHDLTAPLRALSGYAGILRSDHAAELSPEAGRLLGQIDANAGRMAALIEGLLDFSRLGRRALHPMRFSMRKLVNEVVEELGAQHGGAGPEIRVAPLPDRVADRLLLRQVWTNLIGNAVKFSRDTRPPLVEVGYDAAREAFFVRDNGVGFDMRYADKLFRVFSRLHGIAQFEGTGIGLALAERIVRRHGGRLSAEARLAEGATFRFTLP